MKRKLGVLGLMLILAVSITACGGDSNSTKKADKKETEQTENDKKDEENKYSPIVAENVKVADSEYPYQIKVNRKLNCVTVYTLDDEEEYTIPVRAIICSVGGETVPQGTFQLGESTEWQMLASGDYGRYVTRIVDDVYFRSVNYKAQSEDSLDVEAYNCLGDTIEDKAVVLSEADAEWIAKNCPEGTQVEIYDDEEEAGPLGKPLARLISDKITWDPTDESSENAWYVPVSFFGVKDRTVEKGQTPDLMEGITAKDKYGSDLTASIKVYGEVDVNKAGKYKVTYSCENSDGEKREVVSTVTVNGDGTEEVASNESAEETETPKPTKTPKETKAPKETKKSKNTKEPKNTKESKKTDEPEKTEASKTETPETANPQEQAAATPQPEQAAAQPAQTSAPQPQPANNNTSNTITTITTYEQIDDQPPVMRLIGNSANVTSITNDYLYKRISVSDNGSGVDAVYITVVRIPEDDSYIVIYEAFDKAGNSSCISETVYLQ